VTIATSKPCPFLESNPYTFGIINCWCIENMCN
jgi:hypothetical protein